MSFPVFSVVRISIHAPSQGATKEGLRGGVRYLISIHAPSQGATRNFRDKRNHSRISIHAPSQGATTEPKPGSDPAKISIHAPSQGATRIRDEVFFNYVFQSTPPHRGRLLQGLSFYDGEIFQSTPPHRGRPGTTRHWKTSRRFQSTPPHRGRLGIPGTGTHRHDFNPRPLTGGDQRLLEQTYRMAISIHAPSQGAT